MLHATSRTAKIAGVAALSGMMMAVAIVAAIRPSAPPPPLPTLAREDEHPARLAHELDRCATLTMLDSSCEAAWAENRRRFFGQQVPISGSAAPTGPVAP